MNRYDYFYMNKSIHLLFFRMPQIFLMENITKIFRHLKKYCTAYCLTRYHYRSGTAGAIETGGCILIIR